MANAYLFLRALIFAIAAGAFVNSIIIGQVLLTVLAGVYGNVEELPPWLATFFTWRYHHPVIALALCTWLAIELFSWRKSRPAPSDHAH